MHILQEALPIHQLGLLVVQQLVLIGALGLGGILSGQLAALLCRCDDIVSLVGGCWRLLVDSGVSLHAHYIAVIEVKRTATHVSVGRRAGSARLVGVSSLDMQLVKIIARLEIYWMMINISTARECV